MRKKEKKEKCDYCGKDAVYFQKLEIQNLENGVMDIRWTRYACEDCKDESEN